ncbi:MAG TPA: cupin domain-containing protein [Pyrinomonadaceae bacterium]|nr:cupin domain-containing protein [Pyrinomonadaceae bacterium]
MSAGPLTLDAAAADLAKLLAPLAPEDFLASSWGRGLRHVRGGAGKFARLMPWAALNEILRRHRLDFPRLRLAKDGKSLPASDYLRYATGGPRRTSIPRLKHAELNKHLRGGATLVLDAVDELHAPVEELAAALEQLFREHVQVNLYAGFQTSRGFDLHWDDHDVFILQVAGRKRWSVYGMTRPFPISNDIEAAGRPEHKPVWQETLEDGDLLYIPRGWWHVAEPLAEPTLHLTVGVHKRTGLDLLRWLSDRMRASEIFRRDLPRLGDSRERARHAAALREELLNALDDGVVERFFREHDAQAEPRAALSMPWSATGDGLPPNPSAVVRWAAPRPVEMKEEGGAVEFVCVKKRWRFAPAALHVLRPLAERRVLSVAELCEEARGSLDEKTVRTFVGELLLNGLVAVSEDGGRR